jgi:fructose-bisphosphate aldolase, class I
MFYDELSSTMECLLQEGKGILAADESTGTIAKRFETIGLENTPENRCKYRLLLATTPNISDYISGVILYEETFTNKNSAGETIPEILAKQNIVPGIKIDKGLKTLANTEDEKVTIGLDDLAERLEIYKQQGARFAKWRNVYSISDFAPSMNAITTGAEVLARYAATCQSVGIVPIVEPEVLMDGDHSIEDCAEASQMVLHELFKALFNHQVYLPHIILKPSMVTSGKAFKPFSDQDDIVDFTLEVFRNTVPAAVPSINFLSGGQTPEQATINLNALNSVDPQPWLLSFSYGRALQEECLNVWKGKDENIAQAQETLYNRAKANSLACLGEYSK